MKMLRKIGPLLFGMIMACAGCQNQTSEPADPQATEVLRTHWEALQRRDWRTAYDRLDAGLRTPKFTLKHFTDFHTKRRGSEGFPKDIQIIGSERAGDDAVVSFDVLYVPPGGSTTVPTPIRHKVTLRKSGDSWGLRTHDILALRL